MLQLAIAICDQIWKINKEDSYADLGDEFNAAISSVKYQNYVSKVSGSDAVYLQDKNNTSKQLWHFKRQADGAYAVTSCYDNTALEMTNGTRENGTQITAHDAYWEGYYQQWYLLPVGDGYRLLSKHFTSEKWYLDRSSRTTDNGNIVQIYEEYDDDDQIFAVELYSGQIPTDPIACILGDADGDGNVTIFDATAIQRWLADLPASQINETAADADGDGEISIFDATAIQRWLADLPSNANIGKPIA